MCHVQAVDAAAGGGRGGGGGEGVRGGAEALEARANAAIMSFNQQVRVQRGWECMVKRGDMEEKRGKRFCCMLIDSAIRRQ